MEKITKIVIVGGGTAGLISALTLRTTLPEIEVIVLRSKVLGVIGVGEGTLAGFNKFFFDYLGMNRADFYRQTNATWKLGIRFNWGKRGHFNYSFQPACDWKWDNQAFSNGFYDDGGETQFCQNAALMEEGKAFVRTENGDPEITHGAAYHLENARFVEYLEVQAEARGATLVDTRIDDVSCREGQVDQLTLEDGSTVTADLFVDASGFRSMLLQQALKEPFESFADSLFCDRAIAGAWERTDEPILPYTTSDTMKSGWSWRIDHEHHINRGYVYSSRFINMEQAETEFREKNPKLDQLNHLSFTPGKSRNLWIENVVAIGNSAGFVEPLEATSIGIICYQSRQLAETLNSARCRPDKLIREVYNRSVNERWEASRRFLALHYKLNTAPDSPFWQYCREQTRLGTALEKWIEIYRKYGPEGALLNKVFPQNDQFGLNGYLVIMRGLGLDYDCTGIEITEQDRHNWQTREETYRNQARHNSLSVAESLEAIRSEAWEWYS